jgi:hypothetical protein
MQRSHAGHICNGTWRNVAGALLTALLVLPGGQAKEPKNERSILEQPAQVQQKGMDVTLQSPAATAVRSSISLSPAVLMARCKYGQGYRQRLTVNNQTGQDFMFAMEAQDVVVREGKRVFVEAGETAGSIAATAVFSQKEVFVKAGESGSARVTFTVPKGTPLRGAIAMFRGLNKVSTSGPATMTASLGTLFTFTVTDNAEIEGLPVEVTAQSATANLRISETLTNTGSEPLIAHGMAAVLNETGTLVGKTPFEEKRLLPGEQLPFEVVYPTPSSTHFLKCCERAINRFGRARVLAPARRGCAFRGYRFAAGPCRCRRPGW